MPGMGGTAFPEPAAMITASGVMVSRTPSGFVTSTVLGAVKTASPWMLVTPFILSSAPTPCVSVLVIWFLWAMICGKSTSIPFVRTPSSAPCSRISRISSALRKRHFVGMQPLFRQVPPSFSFSTSVTAAPSWAARIAATYPPGPPPMTKTVLALFCPFVSDRSFTIAVDSFLAPL